MINWFGESWGSRLCAEAPRCDVPVGALCLHCEEPIAAHDSGVTMPVVDRTPRAGAYHRNCFLRIVIGSVGHQRRRCSCWGGTDEDPPGLTRRQAADAAAAEFFAF